MTRPVVGGIYKYYPNVCSAYATKYTKILKIEEDNKIYTGYAYDNIQEALDCNKEESGYYRLDGVWRTTSYDDGRKKGEYDLDFSINYALEEEKPKLVSNSSFWEI